VNWQPGKPAVFSPPPLDRPMEVRSCKPEPPPWAATSPARSNRCCAISGPHCPSR